VPETSFRIRHLAFLTPGNYPAEDPLVGLEETLGLFEFGENLGYDSAWVRQRHLEPGISSAAVFLAAAGQRTRRIDIGTAVIPIGYESPFRLAEDLSMADVLSGGRLNIGLSAGQPRHTELIADQVFDGDWRALDMSHTRVLRLLENLKGRYLGTEETRLETPFGLIRPRLNPFAKGLVNRIWYGGGSLRSAEWAGRQGVHLLIGNVTSGEDTDDFLTAQQRQLQLYRALGGTEARVALGRVIVPLDSADRLQKQKYRDYERSRRARTGVAHGPRRTLFLPDLVGTSDEILEKLSQDPILPDVTELRLELPYEFRPDDYRQILSDVVKKIAPALGWHRPADLPHPGTHAPEAIPA
jgi:alkanesulfonate monooxygenase SsuD/methylene tetrahydromethanopterin reductase-like flavin-dependent oxidoreductase (luciferase family)